MFLRARKVNNSQVVRYQCLGWRHRGHARSHRTAHNLLNQPLPLGTRSACEISSFGEPLLDFLGDEFANSGIS